MNESRAASSVSESDPAYVEWRGDLLARLSEVAVSDTPHDTPFDLQVVTDKGACFFVAVDAFSSMHRHMDDIERVRTIAWPVAKELIEFARSAGSPTFAFLFDADTDHGRFLRLDTLPESRAASRRVTLAFPVENAIDRASLERLVRSLEDRPAA